MGKVVDPVIVEVVRNLLLSVADETNTVIIKSAYSTNIKERRDNTVAIMDAKGDVVAQVEGSIPILLATSLFIAKRILEKYRPEEIHPGDMFILNDPYSGSGNHLPDITICAPVFAGDKLIAWISNIAHHSDIGGSVPGSIVGNARSVFEEGIRIPIVRICRDGEVNRDVMDLLLGNTRTREERRGDFTAQISANLIGIEKLQSAYAKYGDVLLDCMEEIQNYADRMMRSTIRKIPDGVYEFEDFVDGCGELVPHPINIRVKITVAGDEMTMDFTGTHVQVEAPINVPFPALMSAILFSIKALVGLVCPPTPAFSAPSRSSLRRAAWSTPPSRPPSPCSSMPGSASPILCSVPWPPLCRSASWPRPTVRAPPVCSSAARSTPMASISSAMSPLPAALVPAITSMA